MKAVEREKVTVAEPAAKPKEKRPAKVEPLRNTIAEWTVTILLLLFGTTTLVQAFVIPTGSMEDNLLIGDHLLVDKLTYSPPGSVSKYFLPYRDVKRGDIIVFRYPEQIQQTYVKRVIGVPGDHIRLENKQLYLNGKAMNEPYKVHKDPNIQSYRDNFPAAASGYYGSIYEGGRRMLQNHVVNGEIVVPPGYYFAMGDNRDQSSDSRYWGFVPRENIVGKPLIIYWSFDASTEDLSNALPSSSHLKNLIFEFVPRTRWNRTFMIIRGYPLG